MSRFTRDDDDDFFDAFAAETRLGGKIDMFENILKQAMRADASVSKRERDTHIQRWGY